jgi:hypothetical protein
MRWVSMCWRPALLMADDKVPISAHADVALNNSKAAATSATMRLIADFLLSLCIYRPLPFKAQPVLRYAFPYSRHCADQRVPVGNRIFG